MIALDICLRVADCRQVEMIFKDLLLLYLFILSIFKRQLSPIHFLRKRLDRVLH